jgi:inner membrane protein
MKPFHRSLLATFLSIGALTLLLQLPVRLIAGLLKERRQTRESAVAEVTRTWGGAQTLAGPFLAVPHLDKERTCYAYFMPEKLEIEGEVDTERRSRGIFDVRLYTARLKISARFGAPDLGDWPIPESNLSRAIIVLGISDPRALREEVKTPWGRSFLPGVEGVDLVSTGIHVPWGGQQEFSCELALGGADLLHILPMGTETRVDLRSRWPDPGFVGASLPETRRVGADGFAAAWRVLDLGRNFPARFRGPIQGLADSGFGVSFLSAVDSYQMTERSVKYQLLFFGLTFAVFFAFELLGGLKIHIVQYLLVGCALCLFYLLLLSLSEHTGFKPAYGLAAASVVGVVGGYCWRVLGSGLRAALVMGMLASLYGFLFVLVQMQDYALLAGSLALFASLTALMYLTRRLDWYRLMNFCPSEIHQSQVMKF